MEDNVYLRVSDVKGICGENCELRYKSICIFTGNSLTGFVGFLLQNGPRNLRRRKNTFILQYQVRKNQDITLTYILTK